MNGFDKFSALIFEVSRHWHKITSDEMANFDLKGTYAVYLSAMYRNPEGITAAKLAEICCRDKADVSRAISAMTEKGMVSKSSPNNNSYRATISLTEKGIKTAEYVLEKGNIAVEMAGTGSTPAERALFYRTLETIASNLRFMSEHGVSKNHIKIKAILFDLDGTLLPMDQDRFMKVYFSGLCDKLAPLGYKREELVNTIWHGTRAMYRNDGSNTNEKIFWDIFRMHYPDAAEKEIKLLDSYYENEFEEISGITTPNPDAKKAVEYIKSRGLRVSIATNPLFPRLATKTRIKWAGFNEKDFEFFTSYEDSYFTKPSPNYFRSIYERMGLKPYECILVGNDVDEDMAARKLGMNVFLLTDNLINKSNKDISKYPHGNFNDLIEYIKEQA
ncbi:MAG: HAD-IA family hydrolase [Clostridia bacterium]|nr:HAD-IA family hydrolase [Clostridia bacterium]